MCVCPPHISPPARGLWLAWALVGIDRAVLGRGGVLEGQSSVLLWLVIDVHGGNSAGGFSSSFREAPRLTFPVRLPRFA